MPTETTAPRLIDANARDGKLEDLGFIFEPITYR